VTVTPAPGAEFTVPQGMDYEGERAVLVRHLSYAEIGRRTGMSETGARLRYWALTGRERADRRKTPDAIVAGNGGTGDPE
jgi:hypothetical protein